MSGRQLCIRVWLRKQRGSDYEPTKENYEAAAPNMKQIQASLTEEDINGAFDRGEEVSSVSTPRVCRNSYCLIQEMGVYTLTCVGYDEDFIRCLVRNVHMWESPVRVPKNKQDVSSETTEKTSRKGMGSKRKPFKVDSNVEQSDGDQDEPWAGKNLKDEEDVKVPVKSVQQPERRSERRRVKRVRTS